MHSQSYSIIRLPVHLPNEQQIYFREGEEEVALERANNQNSMLTAWFVLNQSDETAVQILYPDIPYHYVFDNRQKRWKVRQRGAENIVSRMYNSTIRQGERFFLSVSLLHVPGATSFEYLRTFEGVVYRYFREACLARGLLADDQLWIHTMNDIFFLMGQVEQVNIYLQLLEETCLLLHVLGQVLLQHC